MGRKKGLPFIPVQMPDKDAAFAGKQYLIEANRYNNCNHSRLFPLFRESIRKLLYANFEWTGDITPVEANAIEYKLIETGRVIALRSTADALKRTPGGVYFGTFGTPSDAPTRTFDERTDATAELTFDFYGQPSYASCTGLNGILFTADENNFVIGYDSMSVNVISTMVTPVSSYIDALAENLDNAYSAWRVAVETNKLGMVFDCPDETSARLLRQVLENISENKPFVITRGNMSARNEIMYRPSSQGTVGAFYQNFLNAWSLVLDLLGIENESAQKKERMVVEEAVRNNSLSKSLGYDRLHARQIFAEQVSKKLGKKIQVHNAYAVLLDETDTNGNGKQDSGESGNGYGTNSDNAINN